MKNNFSEVFDRMDAAELDGLLAEMQDDKLSEVSARRIRKAALEKAGLAERQSDRRPRRRRTLAALAACLALILGLGTYAYAAENRTYNEAVKFFTENGLSTEGLTRGEIKAVYRDITTESFTYAKTAEVIRNTARVEGYSIPQETPGQVLTTEQILELWRAYYQGLTQRDVHYRIEYVEKTAEDGTWLGMDKSVVSKYDGQTLLWQVDFTDYEAEKCCPIAGGVIVCGTKYSFGSWTNTSAWMTKLDENGSEVWTKQLDHGFKDEYICALREESDGGYAVVSRVNLNSVCLSRFTSDGEQTLFKRNIVGNYGVGEAALLGDGYLVTLFNGMENVHARMVKMDHDGNLTGSYSYGSDDACYYITHVESFGGKVYLSAYAVPALAEDESDFGGRDEIAGILDPIFQRLESGDESAWDISGEELTPMVRANYTALLLVVDPAGGEPESFFSVEGSLGGRLTAEDGRLLWDVESVESTFFSPATNSFTIGGTCRVYRYTFDESGALLSQVKTDETTVYRR
ncbi:MAG: hypothetical protein II458_07750 [Oscillospiraceae bacterium]|nr:hypothetical protein [Oscillospiraceae bacterium]